MARDGRRVSLINGQVISEDLGIKGSMVVGNVTDERTGPFGYDAQADEYGDMLEKGIIDPATRLTSASPIYPIRTGGAHQAR